MEIPSSKGDILKKAETEVKEVEEQFRSGFLTNGERYNKVVDIWSQTNDRVADEMMEKIGSGSEDQYKRMIGRMIRQLLEARGYELVKKSAPASHRSLPEPCTGNAMGLFPKSLRASTTPLLSTRRFMRPNSGKSCGTI